MIIIHRVFWPPNLLNLEYANAIPHMPILTAVRSRFVLLVLMLFVLVSVRAQNVLVTEIMVHPPGTNLLEQWFELQNRGPAAVDLSGWRVTRGVDYLFPSNTVLAAGGYLVVAADRQTFSGLHPTVTNFVGGWESTIGHALELTDRSNRVVHAVEFYDQGDWAVRQMGPPHFNHTGWEWHAEFDGLGASLELINPALPDGYAHNWGSSTVMGGTPGRPNSIASSNNAPLIADVHHRPVIPQPSDPVTVTARVVDELSVGLVVSLHWRVDGAASFNVIAMADDGAHGDGTSGDGLFGAILPAQPDLTVVEFYLQAQDQGGNLRTYPVFIPPTNSTRTANLLYQVDSGAYAGTQPVYRIIMRGVERAELFDLGRQFPDADSDAQMNATWISSDGVVSGGSTTQIRYNCGVRNRGHGTRVANPNNYHVNIPSDRLWKGQAGINLNAHYAYSQVLGSAVFRRLGVPMADSRAVQVRVNGIDLMASVGGDSFGSYAANEQYNKDFVQRSWPIDPGGNAYRGIRGPTETGPQIEADLTWHGPDFFVSGSYTNAYFKQNNFVQNDYSDLLELLGVLNEIPGYSSSAAYVTDVNRVIDVEAWMRYMAINTLLANGETCLANGVGDDYALYRGTLDTRFEVLPYDLDTVMGRGLTPTSPRNGLWRMTNLPVMDRFMKTPEFAPVYYRQLKTLADTAFSTAQMDPLLDQLFQGYVPQETIDTMKAFNASHVAYVLSQIPNTLVVSNNLPILNGYPHTTVPIIALTGAANALNTRTVLVGGGAATYSAWEGTWSINGIVLYPGINRLLVQALDADGQEVGRATDDVWYDDGAAQSAGGTLQTDTTWTAAAGPFDITSTLTVAAGVTLTLEPGLTVYLGPGVNLVVANGGRLLAEGTETAPIRFTRLPGATTAWGGITINGGIGSPETRITHAHLEFNGSTAIHSSGGTVFLDHLTFGSTDHQYISLDGSSFVVSHSDFPTPTAGFELLHGTGGIKAGGYGIFYRNFVGAPNGYNDAIDFTGGNRPGQPLVHFLENVFVGSGDDLLDLDGTDAWVEGNIFMHCHKNGSPDSSSAVSGGDDGNATSEITIVGNLFYDCDHAATAKQGNFYTLLNNTIVHQIHEGGTDTAGALMNFADAGTTEGAGAYLEGNIVVDAEALVRDQNAAIVTFTNNLLPFPWSGPGGANSTADPRLKYIPQLAETTQFSSWEEAQVLRDWFSLMPGSPAIGTGPNHLDKGGVVPMGASVSGEPSGTNNLTSATLEVGFNRAGSGIPVAGFPEGSGYVAYRYRLDGAAWSTERDIHMPISLVNLSSGPHRVEVSGKRDTGPFQDDPVFGDAALVSTSRTWTVDPGAVPSNLPTVRLNEVLASNRSVLTNGAATPDIVELFNFGSASVDLSGMGLTDNADLPYKFTFAAGTQLAGGAFLVLYGDNDFTAPGVHLGFSIKASGDNVLLHAAAAKGGQPLDQVVFGLQIADYSIGRVPDGTWTLCEPTFGSPNVTAGLGRYWDLKINEWLADAQFAANNDFVELYNPEPQPVPLGGLYLSDAAGAPDRHPIAPLSFISGAGYTPFIADSQPNQGADHLNFKLSPDVGLLLLSAPDLTLIDAINYGPQQTDVSQGRSPDGSETLADFTQPSDGGPNPGLGGVISVTNVTQTIEPLLEVTTSAWRFDSSGIDYGTGWRLPGFDDSGWNSGFGLFGRETTPQVYPYPFQTAIPAPSQSGGHITVYYRTHFSWTEALAEFQLIATNYVDDGAVFYLNGVEVGRLRVSADPVLYASTASNQDNEGAPERLVFPTNSLVRGDNVIGAEVHQANSGSSDDVFGVSLAAIQFTTNIVTQTFGVPVLLNEVLARNQTLTNHLGHTADYVELFNPSTNTVDLSGLSLSTDPNDSRRWVFPANRSLAPSAYTVIYLDDAAPASPTNTGFALGANGDVLYFFNRPLGGGALVDSIRFGRQTPDFSIGRTPDAAGHWTLNLPTPGGPNSSAGLANISALRINEWMADPSKGSDWLELANSAGQPVALDGLFLTDDLSDPNKSPIPPLSFIGTGGDAWAVFIADSRPGDGADHVDFSLSKSGEALGLFSPAGVMIDGVTFGPQPLDVAQGRLPDGFPTIVNFASTASPGTSNFLPLPGVVINEVLTHTDPPLEDAVEFFNLTPVGVNVGGWYLSNSRDDFKKYRIPDGTILPANAFLVLYEGQFNAGATPFTFNSAHGNRAILSQADAQGNLTGYRAEMEFGAAANGVSFGRIPTSVGFDFTAVSATSFGADQAVTVDEFRMGAGLPNTEAKVGPVVLSEMLYYSATGGLENDEDEFIELENISGAPVRLYDPGYPTNTWSLRSAVDFVFPSNVMLDAGGRLLVVGFPPTDPQLLAQFRARFSVPAAVPVFGPWSGHLANDSDSVELYRPDTVQLPPHPDAGFVPQILVDKADYAAVAPWPAAAAGGGNSLQRLNLSRYGNDPANWSAAIPTAGRANMADPTDTDHDGLPDVWELTYFGTLDRDGTDDLDGDGITDFGEYLAGTSPIGDFRFLSVSLGTVVSLEFVSQFGRPTTVEYLDNLGGLWQTLTNVPAPAQTTRIMVTDAYPTGTRFYRLVAP